MSERGVLERLHDALVGARPELATPRASAGEESRLRAIRRLDDYVLPRIDSLDAPLVGVIGGSTGAGKSTLINALVGREVAASSPVRPTTRRPLLLNRGEDAPWFESTRILPGLARVRVGADATPNPVGSGSTSEVELRSCDALPRGLALIDSPDIDSVSDANRALSRQLLDAADLWLFVTTAARYADAVPWELLDQAATSGIEIIIVLNRVPVGAEDAVRADLRRLMDGRGLMGAEIVVINEHPLNGPGIAVHEVAPLRAWLDSLVANAARRQEVARTALRGAVRDVVGASDEVVAALEDVEAVRIDALDRLDTEVDASLHRLELATADGSLLRGEVLARWQEVVGAADLTKSLSRGFAAIRDRFTAWVTGKPAPIAPVEDALEAGLSSLVHNELVAVRAECEEAWAGGPATKDLVASLPVVPDSEEEDRALTLTRDWQLEMLALVREQGASKRSTARIAAIGVNVVSVALIIAVFASTGGLTGAEVGIAGASAVVAQKLLETVFGDQAVRAMTKTARANLLDRMREALEESVRPLREALPGPTPIEPVRAAAREVRAQWDAD